MISQSVNDLTTSYIVIGIVVAILIAMVLNVRTLMPVGKMIIAAVIMISAVGYGYHLHGDQDNIVVAQKRMDLADNAADGFSSIVRQLKN